MKKWFVQLTLVCVVMALICASAFAAVTVHSEKDYVTMEADGDTVKVTVTGVPADSQVLALALSSEGVPTADNIVYIDQDASSDSGISFTIYPNTENLTSGSTYYVYLSSNAASGNVGALEKVGSFVYSTGTDTPTPTPTPGGDTTVTYGDANKDSRVNVNDAMSVINYVAKRIGESDIDLTAADANGDSRVNVNDAMSIINYIAKRSATLGPQA